MTEGHRTTVRLLLDCNNHCVFCAQVDLPPPPAKGFAAELQAARQRGDALTFVGGEPTLDETLPAKIAAARALGFEQVGLQTNGHRLGDTAYVAELVQAGLTDVQLSLHGSEPAVHDYHAGRDGAFAGVLAAMTVARAHSLATLVNTVLTRSNFRVLRGLPELLGRHGVRAWFVSVPVLGGRAAALRDRVSPRLGLAIPFALQALSAAKSQGLPSFIVGAPLCLLGPFAADAIAGEARAYAEVCEACGVRASCPGVDASYLARFEADELVPRQMPAPVRAGNAIRASFVGPGEVAPAATVPVEASSPRRSLPMLGKVKPAHAEVTPLTARRTGEALQEIFPELFAEPAKP